SEGRATSAAPGATTITATDPGTGINGATTLTVTAAVLMSIAVTPANPSIALGRTQQFTATGTYSDNSTQDLTASITWSPSSTPSPHAAHSLPQRRPRDQRRRRLHDGLRHRSRHGRQRRDDPHRDVGGAGLDRRHARQPIGRARHDAAVHRDRNLQRQQHA